MQTQTQAIAAALADPWLPSPDFKGPDGWSMDAFRDVCQAHQTPLVAPDAYHLAVLEALVPLLPTLGVMPRAQEVQEHQAEWSFSRVRCLLCGWGYQAHARAAEALARLHPASPLDPRETEEQWQSLAIAAHYACHWPLGLSLVPWRAIASQPLTEDPLPYDWIRCLAALHLLKHVHYSAANERLIVTYEGHVTAIDPSRSVSAVSDRNNVVALATALALPAKKGKATHPGTVAAQACLAKWPTSALVHRQPASGLPPCLLAGPCPRLTPSTSHDGFSQADVTLVGVRVAHGGRIYRPEEVRLSEADCLLWDWPVHTTAEPQRAAQRWEAAVPSTYDQDLAPHQVLESYCPQVEWISDGHRVLFDSIVIMTLLRSALPTAARAELPLILVLPWFATEDECANIGKSAMAESVLAAVAPMAEYRGVACSDSSPDIRAAVSAIRKGGSIGLDEHNYWPSNNTHPLSQNSLCLLTQGRAISLGQVLENDPAPLQLHAPLVLQAKTAPLRSDLKLRSLPLWLKPLTPEQLADGSKAAALAERHPGTLMRVAAWALIERFGLAQEMAGVMPGSLGQWKFNFHMRLAMNLWKHYTGESEEQAAAAISSTLGLLLGQLDVAQQQAEGSGLQAILDANRTSRLRIDSMWEDFSPQDMVRWHLAMKRECGGKAQGANAADILRAFADVTNTPKADVATAFVRRMGKSARYLLDANTVAIAAILRKELELRMPAPGVSWMLQGPYHLLGWKWVRSSDDEKRFMLLHDNPDVLKGAKA